MSEPRESAILRTALKQILAASRGECERHTRGIGACFAQGYSPDAPYYEDRCCNSCIAHAALQMDRIASHSL